MLHKLGNCTWIRSLLAIALLASVPLPATAAVADQAAATGSTATAGQSPGGQTASAADSLNNLSPEQALARAREFIEVEDFDNAFAVLDTTIARLTASIEGARHLTDLLQQAYLLEIKAQVQYGKMQGQQPQGSRSEKQAYEKAEQLIAECISIKELRHTRPRAGDEYPEKMVDLFERVRGQKLGGFQVSKLDPPDATVLLDADTLRASEPGGAVGDSNLAIGSHRVIVYAEGHKSVTDEIVIYPSQIDSREYRLSKKRSTTWWAAVATGAVAVVGGTLALILGGGEGSSASQPLDPPPPPPGSPGR